jgi:hypothetical protein
MLIKPNKKLIRTTSNLTIQIVVDSDYFILSHDGYSSYVRKRARATTLSASLILAAPHL